MKTLKLLLVLAIVNVNTLIAQKNVIVKEVDEMTGKVYYIADPLILSNPEKTIGFKIMPYIKEYKGKLIWTEFIITSVGIGSCVEKDKLIILFENGTKHELISWNDFNCKGKSYMSMLNALETDLRNNMPTKIRFTNGRSYESYTGDITPINKTYFKDILYSLDEWNKTNEAK